MYGGSRIFVLPIAATAICAPAQALVYLSVEQAQELMYAGHALTPVALALTGKQIDEIEHSSGVKIYPGSLRVWKGDDGGYFFVDAVIGKHDLITYAVALNAEGRVRQTEILEYREAYGGEVRSAKWRAQFTGKQHGDALRVGRDIQNLSGATLSSEHLTDGIRRILATYAIAIAGS